MLGFIIFGWPTKERNIGAAAPGYCEWCDNNSLLHLIKTRQWFTLFWIPVFPISRSKYWLICEICGANIKLKRSEVSDAKQMVSLTTKYNSNEIPEREYSNAVNRFYEGIGSEGEIQEGDIESVSKHETGGGNITAIEEGGEHELVQAVADDRVTTKRDLVHEFYDGSVGEYEDADDWWEEYAKPVLNNHAEIEQLDSTGLRWKQKETESADNV